MSSIAALTGREIELISRFIAVLKEEQDTLMRGEIAGLPESAAEKLQLAEQLNALETRRNELLGTTNDNGGRIAMERWLGEHPEEAALSADWKKLLELARQAKQLHQLNSRLVSMHLQQKNELLSALIQQPPQPLLYSSNGQSATATGSRIVDSA
jgi:flagella synthesis protein FlgN